MTTFGAALRAMREQREMSRLELTALAKVGENTISVYERGVSEPGVRNLLRIARALECVIALTPDGAVEFIPAEDLKPKRRRQ